MRHSNKEVKDFGCGLVLKGDALLLIQRGKGTGFMKWALPGGMKKKTETLEECIKRELEEETNLVVNPTRKIATFFHGEQKRVHVFLCDYVSGIPKAGSDAFDAKFIGITDLKKLDFNEGHLEAIKTFLKSEVKS